MNNSDSSIRSLVESTLQQKNLTVHFQPIVCLGNQTIYGYEGLIRGPVNTLLHSPTMLFDAATKCGYLAELDFLCREIVIKQFSRLNLPGRLFMNIDPVSILHENFRAGKTLELAEEAGIDCSRIIIELTETHPVDDMALMQKVMTHYRDMGFRVALDDLGAGYSGLKLWSAIKPDIVKVDRHFIQGVDEDRTKQQFISTIMKTATSMGCRVITEGVETEKEYATVRNLGVELVQGYYFSRPKPMPPLEIPFHLFRKEERNQEDNDSPTVELLMQPAVSVQATAKVLVVGEMFNDMQNVESIVVVHDDEALGMVLKKEFMNVYASLYGKELYGKEPILKFMNRNILQIEKTLSLEEVSYRLTTSLDLYTEEFIILDRCKLIGKARLIDLLHEITKLRVTQARHANPLTLLPGNVPIQKQLQKLSKQQHPFIICYFDLDNFKPFNDVFGFRKGDEIILLVTELLTTNIDSEKNFIGHIGGDDFVAIFHEGAWEAKVQSILDQFDRQIGRFYDGREENKQITTTDRQGNICSFNRMGLSVGAVVIEPSSIGMANIDLSEEAAIAKHYAKFQQGSFLYIHRPAGQELIRQVIQADTIRSDNHMRKEAETFSL
ncbi:MAG: GGDEF domain-containing protein [Proteobacteria bacterium]|nr:GGDEF domain-containing protein [Pseudomonadota bacterium]MBU1455481.1 GGDEF domain-containing protein [Pseudomonadota bacterium]